MITFIEDIDFEGNSPNRTGVVVTIIQGGRAVVAIAERARKRPQARVVMIALEVDKRHDPGDTSDDTETYNLGTV